MRLAHKAIQKLSGLAAGVITTSLLLSAFATPLIGRASAITAMPATGMLTFTFDDGLASARTLAADALKASGISATNYVITKCVGMTTVPNTCAADGDKPYMSWAQIAELKNNYGWEIGSHTDTHPLLASTDPESQPNKLSEANVISELMNSRTTLANNGYTATEFATPYGDYEPNGHPVLADIAKYYASHRGFGDVGYNTFPFNDYLLVDQQILSTSTPAQINALITAAKTNKQWLILTFHEIRNGDAKTTEDEYDMNVADLASIAAFAKSSGITLTNIANGRATNAGNLFTNASFDSAISTKTGVAATDNAVWNTDNATLIKQNTANNGSFPSVTNSASFASTTTAAHLWSPMVPVSAKPYVIKSFVNMVTASATLGEVAFYVEEYNAAGALTATRYDNKTWSVFGSANPLVREHSFAYTPTAGTASVRLQIVIPANSAETGFLDNIQMWAQDGSTTGSGTVTPPATTGKAGDVNGDNAINALDLSIMLTNWTKTAATRAQGDLSGDGTVNALDLSILLTNWGK